MGGLRGPDIIEQACLLLDFSWVLVRYRQTQAVGFRSFVHSTHPLGSSSYQAYDASNRKQCREREARDIILTLHYMPAIREHRSRCRLTMAMSSPSPRAGARVSVLPPRHTHSHSLSHSPLLQSYSHSQSQRRMPLMYTLPIQRLKEIASHVVPGSVLGTVKEIKSTQLPRLYILKMTDGRPLLLSITPRLSVRLLRHEATIMASEASIIYFLAESSTSRRSTSPASSRASPRSNDGDSRSEEMELEGLVPKMLKHLLPENHLAVPLGWRIGYFLTRQATRCRRRHRSSWAPRLGQKLSGRCSRLS